MAHHDEATGRLWRVVAVLAACVAVVTVAVATSWGPLLRLDHAVTRSAFDATYGHGGRTAAWRFVTDWGSPNPMRVVLLLAAAVAQARRRADLAVWLLALTLLEAVVAPASKLLLDRARPSWADPITVLGSASYPSGHATAAATTAVALAFVVRRAAVRWCAGGVALLVAASRVFLGVHYLSDVAGGLLLGALLASATYAVLLTARPRSRRGRTASARAAA
ncbi:phosphatase PAP2 family protein [Nocardioides anomalus]|uniref:Phosphatase PAP2 family protein n=1 Tax=Nocardioides anomalus TaxID=2712223 RepID=A0A6G6WES6_9ACTN|nr:phosphatase PAP2 family protein [Nocardioides anomalus]QIG43657.1 phosphatase PAP2 family protein [Nocardioides anomalus]